MGYLDVHILLNVPALALLVLLAGDLPQPFRRRLWQGIVTLSLLATIWTTPWDNVMVALGIWTYPPDGVLARIGWIPVEEQAFFVVQTVMTGLLWGNIVGRAPSPAPRDRPSWRWGAAGVVMVATGFCGWSLYRGEILYMTAMLVWFLPVMAVQFAFGLETLVKHGGTVALTILGSTAYLSVLDRIAIGAGSWSITEATTVGIDIAGLPLEEIIFFGLTNTIVVCGLLLYVAWYDELFDAEEA